jgi:cephalosporin hydroxylase
MTPTNTIPNIYSQVAIPNISFMATSKILSTIFQTKEGIVKYPFVTLQLRPQSVIDAGGAYDYASA